MADTIADIVVSNTEFVDVNTLTGIATGISLAISNKTESSVLLQIAASQPSDDSRDGVILGPIHESTSNKIVTSGENTVWAKSIGFNDVKISVQDNS